MKKNGPSPVLGIISVVSDTLQPFSCPPQSRCGFGFLGQGPGKTKSSSCFWHIYDFKIKVLAFLKKKEKKCSLWIPVAWWLGLLYNWSREGQNILRIRDLVEERKAKFRYRNDPVALGVSGASSEPGGVGGGGRPGEVEDRPIKRENWKEARQLLQLSLKCLRQYSVGEFFLFPPFHFAGSEVPRKVISLNKLEMIYFNLV